VVCVSIQDIMQAMDECDVVAEIISQHGTLALKM